MEIKFWSFFFLYAWAMPTVLSSSCLPPFSQPFHLPCPQWSLCLSSALCTVGSCHSQINQGLNINFQTLSIYLSGPLLICCLFSFLPPPYNEEPVTPSLTRAVNWSPKGLRGFSPVIELPVWSCVNRWSYWTACHLREGIVNTSLGPSILPVAGYMLHKHKSKQMF